MNNKNNLSLKSSVVNLWNKFNEQKQFFESLQIFVFAVAPLHIKEKKRFSVNIDIFIIFCFFFDIRRSFYT